MLKTAKYVRKPFAVEAVEVTPENIYEVAKWCKGKVKKTDLSRPGSDKYIKVDVNKPLNERQTEAHYGDWVLSADQGRPGFKVYTPKAFLGSFELVVDHMMETVQRMEARTEEEERAEQEDELEFEDLRSVPRVEAVDPLRPFSESHQ